MFREELTEKLKAIFGFEKVSFDAPGESFEQDTLFVQVHEAPARVTGKLITAKVSGALVIHSQREKLPYGFFTKRMEKAESALTADLFLFDVDRDIATSPAKTVNLCERRCRFLYLFSAQHDPNKGEISGVGFEFTTPALDVGDGSALATGDGNVVKP